MGLAIQAYFNNLLQQLLYTLDTFTERQEHEFNQTTITKQLLKDHIINHFQQFHLLAISTSDTSPSLGFCSFRWGYLVRDASKLTDSKYVTSNGFIYAQYSQKDRLKWAWISSEKGDSLSLDLMSFLGPQLDSSLTTSHQITSCGVGYVSSYTNMSRSTLVWIDAKSFDSFSRVNLTTVHSLNSYWTTTQTTISFFTLSFLPISNSSFIDYRLHIVNNDSGVFGFAGFSMKSK
jgi:hypothetical protein